jgi:hypothetical protein
MSMKISFITILLLCTLFSTVSLLASEGDDFSELKKINAFDGIIQKEAYAIAKAFYLSEISGCGFPEEPVKKSGYWVSQTHVGLAGEYGEPIFIDVNTGAVTWKNKSTIIKLTLPELKNKYEK